MASNRKGRSVSTEGLLFFMPDSLRIFALVKFFALIMGIYILGLSAITCGDSIECNSAAQQTISAPTGHEQHEHSTEHCTPFCTCSCCAVSFSINAVPFYNPEKKVFQSLKYPVRNSSFLPGVSFSIWQPPKLA